MFRDFQLGFTTVIVAMESSIVLTVKFNNYKDQIMIVELM